MQLYPAIDMKNGQCVRLRQGAFADMTVYGTDPAQMALKWQEAGASFLHLVDLDGALAGRSVNEDAIRRILSSVSVPRTDRRGHPHGGRSGVHALPGCPAGHHRNQGCGGAGIFKKIGRSLRGGPCGRRHRCQKRYGGRARLGAGERYFCRRALPENEGIWGPSHRFIRTSPGTACSPAPMWR